MTPDDLPDYLGEDDLAGLGINLDEMLSCEWATESTGHDGRPCWSRDDVLAYLAAGDDEGGEP